MDLVSFSLSLKGVNCFLKIVIIFSLGISLNSSAVNINANTAEDGTSSSLPLHGLFEQFFNIFYSEFYHLSSLAFCFCYLEEGLDSFSFLLLTFSLLLLLCLILFFFIFHLLHPLSLLSYLLKNFSFLNDIF